MQYVSPLQEYEPKDWAGLTTKTHLGAIYQVKPQDATDLVTLLYKANYGTNFGIFLRRFSPLRLKTDDDFRWRLQGSSKKNIPLTSCMVNGSAISSASKVGLNRARFTLIFPEMYFSDTNIIVGHKNSVYPIHIVSVPEPYGAGLWAYECELFHGDPTAFIPYEELVAGKKFSREWSIVEQTLSKKGGTPTYSSPFSMKNNFSMIRMQDTRPGNMIKRPVAFSWPVIDEAGKTQVMTTWMQYADWEFEQQFQDMRHKLLNFATTNRQSDGTFAQKGDSGFEIQQGAGLEQQIESSNVVFFNDYELDIEWLTEHLMDASDNARDGSHGDQRMVAMRTGMWGALQFHKSIKNYTQLYTPIRNTDMLYKKGDGWGFHENFVEYWGPDGSRITVIVDPTYDDKERNKIMHPSGKGVAKSYEYQILNVSRVGGEDNIRLVYQEDMEDIMGYQKGLRDPYTANLAKNHDISSSVDGYTIHRAFIGGSMVKDPTRCLTLRPNILA